MCNTQTSFLTQ